MVIIKTKRQIDGIRRSSKLAATTLKYLASYLKPGISTIKLDQLAVEYIKDHHATAAPLNYDGFPKSICTSINNVVCHGIPSSREILKEGEFGFVYEPGNIKIFCQNVNNIIQHYDDARNLAAKAYDEVNIKYNENIVYTKIEKIIDSL